MANNQPIFILPADTQRFKGRDALSMNINACKTLAGIIRTTLGPKGMDKMLTDSLGDIILTNDGATIVREMDITQPAARMLVEIAKKQEDVVGDGTTSVIVVAGELLSKAQELLEDGYSTPLVIKGFRDGLAKALEVLNDISINSKDKDTLLKIAQTAITGKGAEFEKEMLSDLIVDAALRVEEDGKVDKERINIQRISGDSVKDSFIVDGLIVDKAPMSKSLPRDIKDAKIAVLKYPIEFKKTNIDSKVQITDPSQMQAFIDNEKEMLKDIVDKVIASGADVLFCQKGIDEAAENALTHAGIISYKRVRNTDIERISKATGAKFVSNIDDLNSESLGHAGHYYVDKIFDHEVTFLEKCEDPKATSIILRGSTRHVTEEVKRALDDALGVVAATIEDGKVVVGGAACEIELIKQIKSYAETISGKEQIAILSFADAFEVIPRTLAENAGLDTIDMVTNLKASHENSKNMGLDVINGEIVDMEKEGVLEPLKVKFQAINSASEACEMILRIDDMVAARGALESTGTDESGNDDSGMPPMGGMPGGMPGGMGGMPPMM
ncbi:thermosome subunit alpha [Methanobrevibacter sp. DSM 116169]|uniref:thermosome subunit alpha n=1 Tax=Methanobrevibacter sp. DSM 116169 TaxID=3242727 RepID=UPI0038FBF47A